MKGRCFGRTPQRGLLPLACALLLGGGIGPARAQSVRRDFQVPNGMVRAAVLSGNTLYIAGDFTRVGPVTGAGVPIDAETGEPIAGFPVVVGAVACALPDGAGGWFIGGDFTSVGGLPRAGLAHVRGNGSVAPWDPEPDGPIQAMARVGDTIYAGGLFGRIGGQVRSQLAALNVTSGQATAWDPGPDGAIDALAVSGSTVYAGGAFAHIGGQARGRIAALDAATGAATVWNPNALPDYSSVLTLTVSGSDVYATGNFAAIGGRLRNGIAALDVSSGLATAFDPNPSPPFTLVNALAVSGSTVYVGGTFSTIGGSDRASLAALDVSTGLATAWNPGTDGAVDDLLVKGGAVYVGGAFTRAGGEERFRAAALDTATGAATTWNPDVNPVDATVLTLAAGGNCVFAGGTFASVGGEVRRHLAALEVRTGEPTDWNPDADNVVEALAVRDGTVYAGGDFVTIGGQPRSHLAAIDATSGAVTPWDPGADLTVRAIVADDSVIYAGGEFMHAGGQPRGFVAALDPVSGAATHWAPAVNGVVQALSLAGGTVYVGGSFNMIGGQTRNHIAALDAATGLATGWDPNADAWVGALAVDGGSVIAAGGFTGIGQAGRNSVAALDAGSGSSLWAPEQPVTCVTSGPDCLPTADALALNAGIVYVGGRAPGGRGKLAALDATSGNEIDFTPDPVGVVCTLAASDSMLYAGGDFHVIAGQPQTFLAAIPLDPSSVASVAPPARGDARISLAGARPNPSFGGLSAAFTLPDGAAARLELTDLAGRRVLARDVGGLGPGEHVVELAEGRHLAPGVYLLRLTRGGESVTARAIVIR